MPTMRRTLLPVCLAVLAVPTLQAAEPEGGDYFEKHVRPLLVEHCLKCHGDTKPKGGLRLTSRKNLLAGGDSGPAIVAGQPEKSLLIQAIRYLDTPRMPPRQKLPTQDIDRLVKWVKMGAPWPEAAAKPASSAKPFRITDEQRRFWSFQPVRPITPPTMSDSAWVRNPIDRFILARLEAQQLRPAGAADRRTLIRRVTFDLTGLPPTPEEVAAFVADRRADAYERLVDRLLASPAYGERWGRHWLDLVRYTDSFDARGSGGEMDCADAWRYRDWVVGALNADLPYDRFVTEQIAGDLGPSALPSPPRRTALPSRPSWLTTARESRPRRGVGDEGVAFSRDGIIATGMLALGNWGGGDADKEKLLTDIADDQVDVVSRTFLGLTIGCARCHDHKFDPISTADYYGLAGIFFSTHILPNVGPKTNGPPMLRIPLVSPAELAQRKQHEAQLASLTKRIEATRRTAAIEQIRTLLPQTPRYLLAAHDILHPPAGTPRPEIEAVARREKLHLYALKNWLRLLQQDGYRPLARTMSVPGQAGVVAYRNEADCPNVLVNTTAGMARIGTLTLPPRSVAVHPGPASGVVVSWTSPVNGTIEVSGRLTDADPNCGDGVAWRLTRRSEELARGEFGNGGASTLPADKLKAISVQPGDRLDLVVLPRANHFCDTTTVRLTIRQTGAERNWDLARDMLLDPQRKSRSVWDFHDTTSLKPAPAADLAPWNDMVAKVKAGKADHQQLEEAARIVGRRLRKLDSTNPFWIAKVEDEQALSPTLRESLARLRREQEEMRRVTFPPLAFANGAQDGGVPGSPHAGVHDVRIHVRGRYDRLGERVPRRFPEILAGSNQPPIHGGSGRRELANWLTDPKNPLTARVMVNRLWQHHFGRGIVETPSNFGTLGKRPSHPELLDYLAGEFVRQGWSLKQMHRLLVLSATYQQDSSGDPATVKADPDNLLLGRMSRRRLEAEAIRDSLLAVAGNLDRRPGGPAERAFAVSRRSLYLITVRSDRSGFGPLFDVADSTAPVATRTVSTVAPQALFLLNNDFSQTQARALARRIQTAAEDDRGRINWAYHLLYGRPPLDTEVELLSQYLSRAGSTEVGWLAVCQVLLCANEFVYVD
jgi:hypothetical protein